MSGFYLYPTKEKYEMIPYVEGTMVDSSGIVTYCKTTQEVEEELLFMVADTIMSNDSLTSTVLSELKKLEDFPKVRETVEKIAQSPLSQVIFSILSGRDL